MEQPCTVGQTETFKTNFIPSISLNLSPIQPVDHPVTLYEMAIAILLWDGPTGHDPPSPPSQPKPLWPIPPIQVLMPVDEGEQPVPCVDVLNTEASINDISNGSNMTDTSTSINGDIHIECKVTGPLLPMWPVVQLFFDVMQNCFLVDADATLMNIVESHRHGRIMSITIPDTQFTLTVDLLDDTYEGGRMKVKHFVALIGQIFQNHISSNLWTCM